MHQPADQLSRLKTKVDDKTSLDDEIPDPTVSQEIFACPSMPETPGIELIKDPKGPFIPLILEFCMMAGITEKKKA